MFTFINTSILAFIFAVAIPLFIHLFNKQRKKKIKFSSIRFLQMLERQRLKRIKIYDYLLILLRTLIILTLILAFARPTLTNESLLSSNNARTTSVIILDTGINMSRYDENGNLFVRAQSVLKRLVDRSDPEDELFLIKSTSPNTFIDNRLSIAETNVPLIHGKWPAVLKQAMKIFKENPNFNQELHIISDFEFHEDAFGKLLPEFSGIRIFLIKIGNKIVSNFGIKTVEVKNQIFELNKPIQIDAYIINAAQDKTEPVEIHLFIDKKRVAHQRISVEPMKTEKVNLSFSPKSTGHLSGFIEISDDNLLADNRYYFALKIPSALKLLFIEDNPSVFLRAALTSLSEQSDLQIITENYNSWGRQNFLGYDILVLSNFSMFSSNVTQRIKNYLDNGGMILMIPGNSTIPSDYNRFVASLGISATMKNLISTNNQNEFYYLNNPNLNHPLFSGIFRTDDPELSKPKFFKYFKFIVSTKDQTILSYQNNDPFLIQANYNTGSVFIISSYIDDGWTDIQYRGIFLPLMSRIIHLGASNASQFQSPIVVEKKKSVTINYVSQSGDFYLQSPDGEKNRIIPQQRDQSLQFLLNNIKVPGIYNILAGNEIIYSIPTNAETSAIHQPFIKLDQIEKLDTVQMFSENENFEEAIIQARFGTELWKFFVVLSLMLLGIELFFIKKMEGKVK